MEATTAVIASSIPATGEITLPPEVRERLGVKEGDRVEFVERDGQIVVRAVDGPFKRFMGCVPTFKTTDESTAWIRRMRDGDDE